jgi:hypothetical protein
MGLEGVSSAFLLSILWSATVDLACASAGKHMRGRHLVMPAAEMVKTLGRRNPRKVSGIMWRLTHVT